MTQYLYVYKKYTGIQGQQWMAMLLSGELYGKAMLQRIKQKRKTIETKRENENIWKGQM